MNRFVLTGATGFIGGALLPALLRDGDVLAVSRRGIDAREPVWLQHDLVRALPDVPEFAGATIVHCAAAIRSPDAAVHHATNVEGTRNVLEWAIRHEARRIIVFSTGAVYGHRADRALESDPLRPAGSYANTKKLAEDLCRLSPLPVVLFRLYFPFGREGGIVHRIEQAIHGGFPLRIHRDGVPRMTPIHVDDVVRAVIAATAVPFPPGVYNLCGDEAISFGEIVQAVEKRASRQAVLERSDDGPGDMMGNNARLCSTGWAPQVSVRAYLARPVG